MPGTTDDLEVIMDDFQKNLPNQMTLGIDKYGPEFWEDLRDYLAATDPMIPQQYAKYAQIVIVYHRVKAKQ